jgi:hypothetical protein
VSALVGCGMEFAAWMKTTQGARSSSVTWTTHWIQSAFKADQLSYIWIRSQQGGREGRKRTSSVALLDVDFVSQTTSEP